MKYQRFIIMVAIGALVFISSFIHPSEAAEPHQPNVEKVFSSDKEAKIQALQSRQTADAFKDLFMNIEFQLNRDLAYKAIHTAFSNRRKEAIAYAKTYLKLPLTVYNEGEKFTRVREFNIAKKIFEVFPDEATPVLISLYKSSNEIIRGNIIRASGSVSGETAIKQMLIEALDDTSDAEDAAPDAAGDPLRICDLAYNQLVLRYQIRKVLRTISEAHNIETRDYHIDILKGLL